MLTFIRRGDGRITLGLIVAVALIVLLGIVIAPRFTGPALAISGGSPYSVPLVVDTNPDPDIVETTIVAQEATVDVGNGVLANAQTFNGQLPGPEFHLKVGDTVIVHFENQMSHETGIHWHGIELANTSDGTPLTQNQVPPGGKFLYKFKVPRPGIYWYHPHHHASTNQVFRGMYGSIIVTDPNEAALQASGTLPPATQTLTLALSDLTVCKTPGTNDAMTYDPSLPWAGGGPLPPQPGPTPVQLCETSPIDEDGNARGPYAAGDIPAIQGNTGTGRTNEGQMVTTNGKNVGARAGSPSAPGALAAGAAVVEAQAGQGLRLRIGNTAAIRFFRLILTDSSGTQIPLVKIGGQGGLLDHAVVEGGVTATGFDTKYGAGELLLDPGDRIDVVVAIPATATGVLTLWTQDFSRTGPGFADIPTVPVMHVNLTGVAPTPYTIAAGTPLREAISMAALVEVIGPPTAVLLDPATFSPVKPGMASQDIQLTNALNKLGINGIVGAHDSPTGDYRDTVHPDSTRYAKLGDILELTVTNVTDAHHPFHLHGFSIQPIDLTKTASPTYTWPYHEFRDNVDVPPRYTLRFRVRLDDRPLIDGTTLGGGLGRWVFHCHIFFHATNGMISEFDVVAPTGNEKPFVNADATSVQVNEGQTASMNGTFRDPDGDPVTFSASLGSVVDNGDGTWTWHYLTTDGPAENQLVYVTATDSGGHKDQAVFALKVNNLPPSVSITAPPSGALYKVGSIVTVTAAVSDPGSGDVLTCKFKWDGGGASSTVVASGGSCSRSNKFKHAGVFTVKVTASDDDGGVSAPASVVIVVYDPNDGSVSGDGGIKSPAGAYVADPALTGKATFEFSAKYEDKHHKDAKIPSGKTEFEFHAAHFRFRSTAYEWLVISGDKAQLQGSGKVNGAGDFGFLLTAVDGKHKDHDHKHKDQFRIKVWDKSAGNAVVHDNVPGAPDDIDSASPQAIDFGKIVIDHDDQHDHDKKHH